MSAVRVRHRPPAFASYGSAGRFKFPGRSERRLPRRSPKGESGPRLNSEISLHYYVGATADLRSHLKRHNAGEVSHTSKYAPWTIKIYIAFSDEKQAFAFERYLKSPSGRAFRQETALILIA